MLHSNGTKMKIMVVDDNVTNLNIARKALESIYDVILIPSGEKAVSILERLTPQLILLDIEMPGLSGFEVIKLIKKLPPPASKIPIIFVTGRNDTTSEFDGLNLGAVDYIIKPFSVPLLQKRVELHLKLAEQQKQLKDYSTNLEKMVEAKIRENTKLQYSIVHVLADMVEKRDGSTGEHLLRTRSFIKLLTTRCIEEGIYPELQDVDPELYAHASQMHDVGKISIPDSILLKPGKLTPEEFDIIKTHTLIGSKALSHASDNIDDAIFLELSSMFAGTHHEKWDGTGYPNGLKGEEIPLIGRLMAIVDVYDAITSERPYKKAFSHEEAVNIIVGDSGTHFDPKLVEVFTKIADQFKEISNTYA